MLARTEVDLSSLVDLAPDDIEVCLDPWQIAFSRPQLQKAAKRSFERIGYECWYPVRKVVTTKPLASMSSKNRHKRRHETVERFETVIGCYLLIRKIKDVTFTEDLYELPGIGGLCHFGESVATVADFEVELLRLAEADGRFNEYHASVNNIDRLSIDIDPRRGYEMKTYDCTERDLGRGVDRYGESVYFQEKLGRVLRYIQSAQPPATR